MPREIITIQCGQCGNQVGCRFWELALKEHAANNSSATFDYSLSSFFRNVDVRYNPPIELSVGEGNSPIHSLKARAVLIDMEEGVVNQLLKGPLSDLFDSKQYITGVSGSGNNWAHGHDTYGPQYEDSIIEKIRHEAETCESLQSFFMLHSLGGGTGSGLGSYIMELLNDVYPEVYRLSASIFPSADDDVVTSPYNSLLSMGSLIEHADCVLPIENQALFDILNKVEYCSTKNALISHSVTSLKGFKGKGYPQGKAFDGMNGIIANVLLHLTSSIRFEGTLNVDLNEIATNLVPFPRLHFLVSSLSPLSTLACENTPHQTRAINQLFAEVVSRKHQLIKANPLGCTYLACALLMRGSQCKISDVNENVARMKQRLTMVHWNAEGFKVGICHQPPLNVPCSLFCLANNTCIRHPFVAMKESFEKLYKRRVYIHHYSQYMDPGMFEVCSGKLDGLIEEYASHDFARPPAHTPRFRPVTVGIP